MNEESVAIAVGGQASHAKKPLPIKKIIIILAIVIVVIVAVLGGLLLAADKAANDYVNDITAEYSEVAAGKNLNCTVKQCDGTKVKLASVPLGEALSSRYKKVESSATDYEKLVVRLRHYTAITNKFNSVATQANSGNKQSIDLSSLAADVNDAAKLIEKFYPGRTYEIMAMENVGKAASAASSYDDIASVASSSLTLVQNWLSEERDTIERSRATFEKKINS